MRKVAASRVADASVSLGAGKHRELACDYNEDIFMAYFLRVLVRVLKPLRVLR
jgi:hypothetical protein